MMDEEDIEGALQAVVDDMGSAARRHKAKRYAPKPPPEVEAAPVAEQPEEVAQPSLSELESMLTGG